MDAPQDIFWYEPFWSYWRRPSTYWADLRRELIGLRYRLKHAPALLLLSLIIIWVLLVIQPGFGPVSAAWLICRDFVIVCLCCGALAAIFFVLGYILDLVVPPTVRVNDSTVVVLRPRQIFEVKNLEQVVLDLRDEHRPTLLLMAPGISRTVAAPTGKAMRTRLQICLSKKMQILQ